MDRREFITSIPAVPMIPKMQLEKPEVPKKEDIKEKTQYLRVWTIGDEVEVKKEEMQNLIKVISGVVKQSKNGGDLDMLIGGSVKCAAIPWGTGIDAIIGLTEGDDGCKVRVIDFNGLD